MAIQVVEIVWDTPCTLTLLGTNNSSASFTTDTADRGIQVNAAAMLAFSATDPGGKTATFTIQGSADNVNWWNAPYALVGTPTTFVATAITVASTESAGYIMQPGIPWRYLNVAVSGNSGIVFSNISLTVF